MSLTGIMDSRLMSGQLGMDALQDTLTELRARAVQVRVHVCAVLAGGVFVVCCALPRAPPMRVAAASAALPCTRMHPLPPPSPWQVNADMAAQLGVPRAAAVTCVKPSGTVSQLVDSASGIHPRHSAFYIRRVRCSKDDPLTQFMMQVRGVRTPGALCLRRPAAD